MSFCPEIYKGLFLNPTKQNVHVSPCCQSRGTSVTDLDYTTNEFLQKLRIENAHGVRSTECNRCWETEQAGGTSKRQSSLEFLPRADTVPEIQSLEYNVTWACNLACIMCGPHWSSSWAKELGITDSDNIGQKHKNKIVNSLDLSKLKRIHFNGGEPLINNDHVKLLEKIEHLDTCKVTYNTNGTIWPGQQAIDFWEKAQMVRLFLSIDAIDTAFEYIRWPGKWEQTQNNIEKMKKELPNNVLFGFNITVGAYNLLEVKELYQWFEQNLATNREGDTSDFNWQIAYNFDYKYLPEIIKQDVLEQLDDCKPLQSLYNSVNNCLNYIPKNDWMQKLDTIDARRNTSWKESLKIGQYYK